jgi:hypothetical protein
MLKIIVTSLALTVGLVFTHPSIASDPKTIRNDIVCTDIKTLDEVLTKYGEEAALTMVSTRETRKGVSANAMVFFMNPKTKTWTLIEQFNEKDFCIIAIGEQVSPYFSEETGKKGSKNPKAM